MGEGQLRREEVYGRIQGHGGKEARQVQGTRDGGRE